MNNVSMGRSTSASANFHPRFGCIAARIGSDHMLKLRVDITVGAPGQIPKTLRKGTSIQLGVHDLSRNPAFGREAKWYCVYCRQDWDSKEELLAAHPDNRILAKQQETHLYYAHVQRPASSGKPAKHDDKGKEVSPAVEPVEGVVMLLSDEE